MQAGTACCAPTDPLGAWKRRGTACRAPSSRPSTWLLHIPDRTCETDCLASIQSHFKGHNEYTVPHKTFTHEGLGGSVSLQAEKRIASAEHPAHNPLPASNRPSTKALASASALRGSTSYPHPGDSSSTERNHWHAVRQATRLDQRCSPRRGRKDQVDRQRRLSARRSQRGHGGAASGKSLGAGRAADPGGSTGRRPGVRTAGPRRQNPQARFTSEDRNTKRNGAGLWIS